MISIITINYNNVDGLRHTLKSIIEQKDVCEQFIIIDGASTDSSMDLIDEFDLSKINDVQIVSEPDKGLYEAMNKGLDRADQQFVVFMNSGDFFVDQKVLSMVKNEINNHNSDFIFGDYIESNSAGFFYKKARPVSWHKNGMITSHQAMYFRRSVINNLRYQCHYKFSADYCFISEFLKLSKSDLYIDEALCVFDATGISNTSRFQALKENFDIRYHVLGLSLINSSFLYVAHFCHTVIKKSLPGFARFLRKSKPYS